MLLMPVFAGTGQTTSAADRQRVDTTELKVMSFNIRFPNPADSLDLNWDSRKAPIRRMLDDIRPDIIGMQEPRWQQWNEVAALCPEYRTLHILADDEVEDARSMRIMILYDRERFFRLADGRFYLSPTPDIPSQSWDATDRSYRGAQWVHLLDRHTGKDLYFVNTHFVYKSSEQDDDARAKSSQLIVARMREIAGEDASVFVVGDMNAHDDPRKKRHSGIVPFYEWMEAARDKAATTDSLSSFNGFGRNREEHKNSLDHIFYRNAIPKEFRTITSHDYGVYYISDHYPIICIFEY